jgi:tRNA1(Val) A37 N6-methylase TrmN6
VQETTTDRLLNGRVIVRQPRRGYRAAIDPVFLAAAVPARPGQSVLDLGCGAGAAMFCLAARVPSLTITGVEVQEDYSALAGEGAVLNAALGKFEIIMADAVSLPRGLSANTYHHAMMNPPYFDTAGYDKSPLGHKSQAQAMAKGQLAAWVKSAHGKLRDKGSLTVIYPAEGLTELLQAMDGKFGGMQVFPLWPKAGVPAKRVVIQGKKSAKMAMKLMSGMILHEDGHYTAATEAVLRDGAALHFS